MKPYTENQFDLDANGPTADHPTPRSLRTVDTSRLEGALGLYNESQAQKRVADVAVAALGLTLGAFAGFLWVKGILGGWEVAGMVVWFLFFAAVLKAPHKSTYAKAEAESAKTLVEPPDRG